MVDGDPSSSGVSALTPFKGEYYVVDYGSRMKLGEAPIQALSRKTVAQLSQSLNGIKILPSEEGYLRDWRGLAHCAKFKSEMVTFLSDRGDPTKELLEQWAKQPNPCKLSDLQVFLGQIDRWDVIDDTYESFLADAERYVDLIEVKQLMVNGIHANDDHDPLIDDSITEDDIKLARQGLPPQRYHAYVLYADEDVEFATELIERMENAGLKLCTKSRDLLVGTMSHDAILRLIRERCHRLIIVVSPAFLQSNANTFFMTYAQALGIEQNRRKIVPCIYKRCILPPQLNFYFALHFEARGKLFNFWDKLQQSIQSGDSYNIAPSTVGVLSPKITITEIDSSPQVEMVREARPQMFPPPPKLRSGSSMFDLSTTAADEPDQASGSKLISTSKKSSSVFSRFRLGDKDKSKSSWDLTSPPTSSTSRVDNVLSPPPGSLSPPSPALGGTSKKTKWYKKIMTSKSGEKKKSPSSGGDVTPTSTQSFDTASLTSHGREEMNAKTHKKYKKKTKLLAW